MENDTRAPLHEPNQGSFARKPDEIVPRELNEVLRHRRDKHPLKNTIKTQPYARITRVCSERIKRTILASTRARSESKAYYYEKSSEDAGKMGSRPQAVASAESKDSFVWTPAGTYAPRK